MATRTARTQAHVALLRGINVGGKNRLPMKDLAEIFSALGCTDVRTYIQSGNVVFKAPPALARRVAQGVSDALAQRFALRVPVLLRNADEMRAVARGNPFLATGVDPRGLHVAFLAAKPARPALGTLDPHRSPPDEFAVRGREIYLHCPNGMGRSKLTNGYFDAKLGTTSTIRNWATVLKLDEWISQDLSSIDRLMRSRVHFPP